MSIAVLKLRCSCGATFEAHESSMGSRHEISVPDLGSAWHKLHAPCRKLAQTPSQPAAPSEAKEEQANGT